MREIRTVNRLSGPVEDGILARRPDPEHAGRHLYQLTTAGHDVWPVIHALLAWGCRHRHPNSRVFKHAACATRLDDRGHCAKCEVTPGRPERHPDGAAPWPRQAPRRPVAVVLRTPHRLLDPVET
jgi:HxlR-like helix-turn-helix